MIPLLKECVEKLKRELEVTVQDNLITTFAYQKKLPSKNGQYWSLDLFIFHEDESRAPFDVNIGYFRAVSGYENTPIDINRFFDNNDNLVSEFFECWEIHKFENLLPLLLEIEAIDGLGYNASITIKSFVITNVVWLRYVCEETLLIIHPDENYGKEIYIGVQQSERWRLEVKDRRGVLHYRVPFDKVKNFANAQILEAEQNKPKYQYEIALSFAGEDRDYVNEVARELKKNNVKLFYDDYEKVTLWGRDLYTHLDDIYKNKSMYCIIFLSKFYKEKLWTNHERESAQERAFLAHEPYILPVRLDETSIPGIRTTTGYLDGVRLSPKEIAMLAIEKLKSI
ncbi:TIR domain-containing protein [Mucilaginibacter sp. RS28]|uniref:TIR domain-containing protein n=1 Tax=Mucilaginibacter straminoryzae TaxID=2932774 RepID=A0A9X2BA07_9SPHI|nr:TIR domain-containing protein [Mucilaginibacter straminoryzae]MCJ8210300.1 TIR domain-containing protein [Mucilaginibacter straminoryzae]